MWDRIFAWQKWWRKTQSDAQSNCKVTLKKQQIPILIPHQQYALTAAIFQPGDPAKKAEIFPHLREYYLQLEIQTESSGGLNQLAM